MSSSVRTEIEMSKGTIECSLKVHSSANQLKKIEIKSVQIKCKIHNQVEM